MVTRSGTVLASGTASAAKFFVAALAFTAAYAGLSAYGTAASAPAHELPATAPALAARALIATDTAAPRVTAPALAVRAHATTDMAAPSVSAGRIQVSAMATGPGCLKTFATHGLIVNPAPERTVSYHWRLTRWNPGTNTWRTYLVHYSGFAGGQESVTWDPAISANPGWYRVELKAEGATTVRSDRFQVSC